MNKQVVSLVLPLPRDLQVQSIDLETAFKHVPANALLIVENESLFLALCSILQDLKRTILSKALGYVYLGKIGYRWVFLQYCSSKTSVLSECLEILKPNAVIILGFCAAHKRTIRVKDFVFAEKLLLQNKNGNGKPLEFQCSDFLLQMFSGGKFGWQHDEINEIHVGKVMMSGSSLTARGAETPRASRLDETAKASGSVAATWKSTVAGQGLLQELQLRQEKHSCDWIVVTAVTQSASFSRFRSTREVYEPQLAVAMASFLHRVLQDDQVFRLLEANNPTRPNSVTSLSRTFPYQESLQSVKSAAYEFGTFTQEKNAWSKSVIDQTNLYWEKAREAVLQGHFKKEKTPVENIQEDVKEAKDWLTQDSVKEKFQILRKRDDFLTVSPLPLPSPLSPVTSCFASVMQTVLPPVGSSIIARGARMEIIDVFQTRKTVDTGELLGITGPYPPALPPIKEKKTRIPNFK